MSLNKMKRNSSQIYKKCYKIYLLQVFTIWCRLSKELFTVKKNYIMKRATNLSTFNINVQQMRIPIINEKNSKTK